MIDKNSPGHTNGESTEGTIKERESIKLKQGEAVLIQEPTNQVNTDDKDARTSECRTQVLKHVYASWLNGGGGKCTTYDKPFFLPEGV